MTRNNADFHGITISHEPGSDGETWVEATHPEYGSVGSMRLSPTTQRDTRTVLELSVQKEHRRKGIASSMWRYAKDQGLAPEHDTQQTKKGAAWAKAVGD